MILQLRKRLKSIFLLKRLHSLIDSLHKKKEVARFQLRSLALITIQQLFPLLHQLYKTRTFSKCNRFRFRQLKAKSHQKVKLLLKTLDSTLSIIMILAFQSLNRIILLQIQHKVAISIHLQIKIQKDQLKTGEVRNQFHKFQEVIMLIDRNLLLEFNHKLCSRKLAVMNAKVQKQETLKFYTLNSMIKVLRNQ